MVYKEIKEIQTIVADSLLLKTDKKKIIKKRMKSLYDSELRKGIFNKLKEEIPYTFKQRPENCGSKFYIQPKYSLRSSLEEPKVFLLQYDEYKININIASEYFDLLRLFNKYDLIEEDIEFFSKLFCTDMIYADLNNIFNKAKYQDLISNFNPIPNRLLDAKFNVKNTEARGLDKDGNDIDRQIVSMLEITLKYVTHSSEVNAKSLTKEEYEKILKGEL